MISTLPESDTSCSNPGFCCCFCCGAKDSLIRVLTAVLDSPEGPSAGMTASIHSAGSDGPNDDVDSSVSC